MRFFGYEIIKASKVCEARYKWKIKCNELRKIHNRLQRVCSYHQGITFEIAQDEEQYIVFCDVFEEGAVMMKYIKTFPYGDDKQYARVCAEELCELLNQSL